VAHCYDVIGITSGTSSVPSPQTCWTTPPIAVTPSVPATPGTPTLSSITNHSMIVSFTDNSTDELGFQLERRGGSTGMKMFELDANQTTMLDGSLESRTRYDYRGRAVSDVGVSQWTPRTKAKTLR
jgi:hypothetical protein